MIDPPRKGQPYPGRLPPLIVQWRRLGLGTRTALIGLPLLLVVLLLVVDVAVGATAAVLFGGAAAATATYAKNRTDRHNAAVDRGEVRLVDDPQLRPVDPGQVDPEMARRIEAAGLRPGEVAALVRFDGGWLVRPRHRNELGVVLGDDGGVAYFHSRWVTDLWAASEYRAGRGREPA